MQMNAREAMHLIELRCTSQGHPVYRKIAQEMHRLIAEEAGHHAIAGAMSFVDHSEASSGDSKPSAVPRNDGPGTQTRSSTDRAGGADPVANSSRDT